MNRPTFFLEGSTMKTSFAALALVLTFVCLPPLQAAERPNIVLVLADDLGYGDLHCYGGKEMQTPNLDRFAKEGLRLTSCYAGHPNCSPSRTALMTGRTPTRVGVRNWIPEDSPMHLKQSEITVAALLKNAGYATCHVGKWHLNGAFNKPSQPQPGDHGFDHWFSAQNNAGPSHKNPNNFVRNGKPVGELEGYSAHLVADEALAWLKSGRDAVKPFFLYCCFHEPHEPIATDEKYAKLYPSDDPTYSAHHGNITQMDDAFGRLMRGLDELGLRDNTFVMFTSDNGPAITPRHPHGSAGPLRDKKGSVYEGGIRVPGMIRWPGKVQPGKESDEPACGVDFLPTVCEITGLNVPADRRVDGASLVPVFSGGMVRRTTPLYWHFNHAFGGPLVALRSGDWKIVATLDKEAQRGTAITPETERAFKTAELKEFELYNLMNDIGEKQNLAAAEPAKFGEMKTLLAAKYREVRDEAPTWPAWTPPAPAGKKKK
jgi:arylsulfatase A